MAVPAFGAVVAVDWAPRVRPVPAILGGECCLGGESPRVRPEPVKVEELVDGLPKQLPIAEGLEGCRIEVEEEGSGTVLIAIDRCGCPRADYLCLVRGWRGP